MKWYYHIAGGHTHVRVFMNGGKCGDLCFRNDEFEQVRECCTWVKFINDQEGSYDDMPPQPDRRFA